MSLWMQLYRGDNPESCLREVPSVVKSSGVWRSLLKAGCAPVPAVFPSGALGKGDWKQMKTSFL